MRSLVPPKERYPELTKVNIFYRIAIFIITSCILYLNANTSGKISLISV